MNGCKKKWNHYSVTPFRCLGIICVPISHIILLALFLPPSGFLLPRFILYSEYRIIFLFTYCNACKSVFSPISCSCVLIISCNSSQHSESLLRYQSRLVQVFPWLPVVLEVFLLCCNICCSTVRYFLPLCFHGIPDRALSEWINVLCANYCHCICTERPVHLFRILRQFFKTSLKISWSINQ